MYYAYLFTTVLAAAFVAFSAICVFVRAPWVTGPLADYGVPESWMFWLGTAKAAGAAGLLVGLFVPVIGLLATIGLCLYFTGALITVLRARAYTHIAAPLMYVAPVVVAAVLGAAV